MSRAVRRIASLLLPGCGMITGRFEFPDITAKATGNQDDTSLSKKLQSETQGH